MEIDKALATFKFNPAVFDPNKEQLLAIKNEVANITADPTKITKDELELVNTTKNKLVKARTRISEIGKGLRADALTFQREVIAYEKDLIEIIEPEELRLKAIEKGAKDYAIRQERLKSLPEMMQKLASIGDDQSAEMNEEDLIEKVLGMDPTQFEAYYNGRLSTHLERQKAIQEAKIKAEQDAIAKEREDIEREKRHLEEVKAAENRAREQAEAKAKQEAEDRERQIKLDKEANEKAIAEAKEREEAELKAKTQKEKYQKFLKDNNYNAETDIVNHNGKISTLYRFVAEYKEV